MIAHNFIISRDKNARLGLPLIKMNDFIRHNGASFFYVDRVSRSLVYSPADLIKLFHRTCNIMEV
jgi:hypothetical protein